MAFIQNDIHPVSTSALVRTGLVILALVVGVLIIVKVYKMYFQKTAVDEFACMPDAAYHYKDPQHHPQDCY